MESKFSVLISLYNKEQPYSLKAALDSISQQSLQPDQVVIVFDGYISQELELVVHSFTNQLKDLTIVRLDKNVGLGKALNYGLFHCKYNLVARMDTDDICYPSRFEKQISHMLTNQSISVLGCTVQEFNINPNDTGLYRKLPLTQFEIERFSKMRNPLNHPTVVFRKDAVLASGSYLDMPLFEDFYLWIRMLNEGFILENIEEPLLHFRTGNDMVGRRHGLSYLIKEMKFHRAVKKMGFINNLQFFGLVLTKIPLRLAPKRILKLIYKKILR